WSLGIVMYELLTGDVPFDGDGVGEVFAAVLEQQPKSIRARRPDVPDGLEQVVLRCLQKTPEERFQNAAERALARGPVASCQWSYLVEGIQQTLRRSATQKMRVVDSPEGRQLLENAEAAANRSRPPTAMPSDEPVTPPTRMVFTRSGERTADGVPTL